eukprot:1746379-Rhodomonas_salina.2
MISHPSQLRQQTYTAKYVEAGGMVASESGSMLFNLSRDAPGAPCPGLTWPDMGGHALTSCPATGSPASSGSSVSACQQWSTKSVGAVLDQE